MHSTAYLVYCRVVTMIAIVGIFDVSRVCALLFVSIPYAIRIVMATIVQFVCNCNGVADLVMTEVDIGVVLAICRCCFSVCVCVRACLGVCVCMCVCVSVNVSACV